MLNLLDISNITDFLEIIYTFIETVLTKIQDVWTFFKIFVGDIPVLLLKIFIHLPSFFQYCLGLFLSFLAIFLLSRFVSLILPMKK